MLYKCPGGQKPGTEVVVRHPSIHWLLVFTLANFVARPSPFLGEFSTRETRKRPKTRKTGNHYSHVRKT